MKKSWKMILAAGLFLCLAGCGFQKDAASQAQAATLAQGTETGAQAAGETGNQTSRVITAGEAGTPAGAEAAEPGRPQNGDSGTPEAAQAAESAEAVTTTDGAAPVAVVYFSGTGNTKAVAELAAQVLAAPVYEIVPEVPYTSADLNYRDDNCRANREMEDETARPAIASDLSAVAGCKRLYMGYPVWWGTAPRIIQTFLESQDMAGVEIYTFCTSGGSGVEQSVRDLKELYPGLNIVSGHRFASGASEDTVRQWLAEHQ